MDQIEYVQYTDVEKVLILSDSHGRNSNLQKAVGNMGGMAQLVIHLGDFGGSKEDLERLCGCPVELVRGNCDSAGYHAPLHRFIQIGPHKILLLHGHTQGVKSGTGQIKDMARTLGADIVMFGHTHVPLIEPYGDVAILNPGSISQPRQSGFRPTYLVMNIGRGGKAEYNLVTL